VTPPNAKRHLVCPHHGKWSIEVGENERCPVCGGPGEPVCACGCRASLLGLRSDAVYRSEACAKRLQRHGRPDVDPTGHPLQTVRDQQATKKHNRDLSGLIRQAIIDRIKTTGECFADDLIDLYPEGEVKECRRLATAQFGSLAGSGLIEEKERRKSTIAARKGAKSGVYIFTRKGQERFGARTDYESVGEIQTLVGNGAGPEGASSGVASIVSGEGTAEGRGQPPMDGTGAVKATPGGTSPDQSLVGNSSGRCGDSLVAAVSGEGSASVSRDTQGPGGASLSASLPADAEPAPLPGLEESSLERMQDREAA